MKIAILSKTHKRSKRTLFNWTKQDKMREFSRKSSFFQPTYNTKNKRTINSLIYCQLAAWMPAEGRVHPFECVCVCVCACVCVCVCVCVYVGVCSNPGRSVSKIFFSRCNFVC